MMFAIAIAKHSRWVSRGKLEIILNHLQMSFSKALASTVVGIWNFPQEWQPERPGECDLEIMVLAMNFPGEFQLIKQTVDQESEWLFGMLDGAGLKGFIYVLPAVGEQIEIE